VRSWKQQSSKRWTRSTHPSTSELIVFIVQEESTDDQIMRCKTRNQHILRGCFIDEEFRCQNAYRNSWYSIFIREKNWTAWVSAYVSCTLDSLLGCSFSLATLNPAAISQHWNDLVLLNRSKALVSLWGLAILYLLIWMFSIGTTLPLGNYGNAEILWPWLKTCPNTTLRFLCNAGQLKMVNGIEWYDFG
jgi:hypothetical protein